MPASRDCDDGWMADDHRPDEGFIFTIEDMFTVAGRTVVSGHVECGNVDNGDLVSVLDGNRVVATTRVTLPMVCTPGQPPIPQEPTLCLGGVDRDLLAKGFTVRRAS